MKSLMLEEEEIDALARILEFVAVASIPGQPASTQNKKDYDLLKHSLGDTIMFRPTTPTKKCKEMATTKDGSDFTRYHTCNQPLPCAEHGGVSG